LCAGTGSRLGLSVTKALIKINETMLIQYHLNRLSADFDLVFVVVGFQLKEVIINSKDYWENIVYVINHSYSSKGPGHSLFLAVKYINNSIFVLDCDLIISRKSYLECLRLKHEFLGVSENRSNNPITVKLNNDKVISFDKSFSDSVTFEIERKDLEWTGPLNIHSSKIKSTDGQIFELLENLLPMSMFKVNAFDIDTMSDYVYAQQVFRNYQ
jgi:choline kinase